MGHHQAGRHNGILFETELAARDRLHVLGQEARHILAALDPHGWCIVHISPRSHAVETDRNRLLAHRFRCRARNREIRELLAEATFLDQFTQRHQDAAVVDAGAEMQHRRNTDRLTDFLEPLAGIRRGGLGLQQPRLGTGRGGAAGHDHQDIVLDELLDHLEMAVVLGLLDRIAADHCGHTTQASRDDAVVERTEAGAVAPPQVGKGVGDGEAGHEIVLVRRDVDRSPVREVLHRAAHNVLGDVEGPGLLKLDVFRSPNTRLLAGRDDLGVEAPRMFNHGRDDALYVDQHHIHRARRNRQLLVEEVAHHRGALPHQDLVGGTADATHHDSFGALAAGQFKQLRVATRGHHHLREGRFMTVHHNVDLFGLEHAQVHLAAYRLGRSEENVAQVRGQHGTRPSIPHGGTQAVHQDILVVGIHALVGAMQSFDDLVFDADRNQTVTAPLLDRRLRGACGRVVDLTLLVVEFSQSGQGQLLRDRLLGATRGLDVPLLRDLVETLFALDFIALCLAAGGHEQGLDDVMTVIRVGRHAGSDLANEMARYHGGRIRSADAARVLL